MLIQSSDNMWFCEREALWPGQRFSLQVEKVLFEQSSQFQQVLVFKSKTYGNVLALDGVIQLTERDEFSYQEMMTHLPLFSHSRPKRVLIIGGGDGGVLREVCLHPGVESITMCELDPMVCEVSKKYLPTVSCCFKDPRVTLVHNDGAQFLEYCTESWDVIIVDSADPDGPAEVLYQAAFFQKVANSLDKKNGMLCMQGECMWLHLDLIADVMKKLGANFNSVDYAYTTIPTYPSGQIGIILASHDPNASFRSPVRTPSLKITNHLRYYNVEVHRASFILPTFAESKLSKWRKQKFPVSIHISSLVGISLGFIGIGLGILLSRR